MWTSLMAKPILAAAVQMTSTADVERNLATAERWSRPPPRAARSSWACRRTSRSCAPRASRFPRPQALDGPWVRRMAELARRHRLTLLLGSLPERDRRATRACTTRRFSSDPTARSSPPIARSISSTSTFRVSSTSRSHGRCKPGEAVVVADTPAGRIGLSICYDVRFPELYRRLARDGARVLAVPSAFTDRTGKDHWEVLLRARAIENLAYVFAPAQAGHHGKGRTSHGHAMIVDPWGTILAQVADGEGIALAELDFDRQDRLRRELPALDHVRL